MYSRSLPPRVIWGREGVPRPETLNALLGDYAESQTRDIQTCRHCGDVIPPACVTDGPTATDRPGRCTRHYHLPTTHREQTPPRDGWGFCSLRATGAGLPLSLCSLPPKSIGAASPFSLEPGRVEQRGQRGNTEPERAKRAKPFRAAGVPQRH